MSYQYESFNYGQVSVTSAPTQIVGINRSRQSVIIVNHGSADVYLGDVNVTTSTGLLLVGSKGIAGASVTIPTTNAVYGIVATSEETVSYLEVQK
jgi:hypothetical protein